MDREELPENIAAKVTEWLGNHSVLHFWECDGTFMIIARSGGSETNLYCLRIFPIGPRLELSQDNVLYI